MNHAQIVDLANAVLGLRPDWQQAGIVSQLKTLDANWRGSQAAFYVHAMAVAANPSAHTPGAFNAIPPAQSRPKVYHLDENDKCFICGQSPSRCAAQREHEIRHGIPDPHEFESFGDAKANAVPRPARIMQELTHLLDSKNLAKGAGQ